MRWLALGLLCSALVACGQIDLEVSCQSDLDCATAGGCYESSCSPSGQCVKGPLKDNACFIAGECYLAGQDKPGDLCSVCRPDTAWDEFTLVTCEQDGFSCETTTGQCVEDVVPEPDVEVAPDVVEPPEDVTGPLDDVVEPADVVDDVAETDVDAADDAGEPGDVVEEPDTTTPPEPTVLYGAGQLAITIGESEVSVVPEAGGEPSLYTIEGETAWDVDGYLVLKAVTDGDGASSFMVAEFAGSPQGWELPATKADFDAATATVGFVCAHGQSETLEEAQALVGTANAVEPHRSGCPMEEGNRAWLLVSSTPDLLDYWGADSCCASHDSGSCAVAECSAQVCDDLPQCCDAAWDDTCVAQASACTICDHCGDAYCDSVFQEDCGSCPQDCGACVCDTDAGEGLGCDGTCVAGVALGNGICEAALDCAATEWDGGDCCADGKLEGCSGACVPQAASGNGICDGGLNCEEANWDGGDCCPSGQVKGCNDVCVAAALLGNDICNQALNCEEFELDDGDCCAPGQSKSCAGTCVENSSVGNDICDGKFNCPQANFDDGDCCADGTALNCFGNACLPTDWLGNGTCDFAFQCEAQSWDNGDCIACDPGGIQSCDQTGCLPASALGDGQCDVGLQCDAYQWDAGDCGVSCADGESPSCDQVSCQPTGWINDNICDAAYLCDAYDFDGDDCCFGGSPDQICQPNVDPPETGSTCPADCGSCANDSELKSLIAYEVGFSGDVGGQESWPLTDAVMAPNGVQYVTWATAEQVYVTEFGNADPTGLADPVQGQTASQGLVSPTIGAPALARRSDGRMAIAYRTVNQGGVFLMRSTPSQPIGLWAELQVLADGVELLGRVDVAYGPSGDDVFISTLYSLGGAGGGLVGVLRVDGNGGLLSEGVTPLGNGAALGNGAESKHSPAITSLKDGRAVVTWVSGGGIALQWMTFDGDTGPMQVLNPSQGGLSIQTRPAIAVLPDGMVLIAAMSKGPQGFWLIKAHPESAEVVQEVFKSVDYQLAEFVEAAPGVQPRPFDLATNADGWGLLSFAINDGGETSAVVKRIQPDIGAPAPADLLLAGAMSTSSIAASGCFDDAVVVMTSIYPGEPLRRMRLLADDDMDGNPDLCCVAE